jgi:hypothetical protein
MFSFLVLYMSWIKQLNIYACHSLMSLIDVVIEVVATQISSRFLRRSGLLFFLCIFPV